MSIARHAAQVFGTVIRTSSPTRNTLPGCSAADADCAKTNKTWAKNNETSSEILIRTILSGENRPIKPAKWGHVSAAKRQHFAVRRALLRATRAHYNRIVRGR